MGAVGSALTTTLVRVFLGIAIVLYILRMKDGPRFGVTGWPNGAALVGWWPNSAKVRSLGYAGGAGNGAETTAHSILTQFAGLLGVLPVAAYSIAANVEAVMFMVALGIGSATAVLVGNAWGRGDVAGARLAAGVGVCTTALVMSISGVLIAVFRQPLAELYSNDAPLVKYTAPLLPLVGLAIVVDGVQLNLAQSVRSLGDTWAAAARYAGAFLGVMVPLGWILAFGFDMGVYGLLYALIVGGLVSVILQGTRLMTLLRRGV